MKTQFTIAEESFDAVMDELSKEIANTLTEIPHDGPWITFDVFFIFYTFSIFFTVQFLANPFLKKLF